jgi:hypothetical protein
MSDYKVLEVAIEGETKPICKICKSNSAEIEFKGKIICKYCYMDLLEMGDN